MPVAPENRHRYPADWETRIRPAMFARSGGRCECDGRCGRGVHAGRCPERHLQPAELGTTGHTVRLTVDIRRVRDRARPPGLARPELIDHHRQSAVERRQAALEQAGQLVLGLEVLAACSMRRGTNAARLRTWRWRTIRNPWPGPERVPHPLAHRAGEPVRELARGRNGNALLEFPDGGRVVAPWRSAA